MSCPDVDRPCGGLLTRPGENRLRAESYDAAHDHHDGSTADRLEDRAPAGIWDLSGVVGGEH